MKLLDLACGDGTDLVYYKNLELIFTVLMLPMNL